MALKQTILHWSLPTLSIFLGFFFFFSGILKVSPSINRDIHREIRRNFVQYTKFIPFNNYMKLKITPSTYRMAVGYTEVVCGLVLACVSGRLKQFINLFLIVFMSGAIYTHISIGDNIEKMLPAILMTILLITRYGIYIYQRRQQIKQLMASGKGKYLQKQQSINEEEEKEEKEKQEEPTTDKEDKKKRKTVPKKQKKESKKEN